MTRRDWLKQREKGFLKTRGSLPWSSPSGIPYCFPAGAYEEHAASTHKGVHTATASSAGKSAGLQNSLQVFSVTEQHSETWQMELKSGALLESTWPYTSPQTFRPSNGSGHPGLSLIVSTLLHQTVQAFMVWKDWHSVNYVYERAMEQKKLKLFLGKCMAALGRREEKFASTVTLQEAKIPNLTLIYSCAPKVSTAASLHRMSHWCMLQ